MHEQYLLSICKFALGTKHKLLRETARGVTRDIIRNTHIGFNQEACEGVENELNPVSRVLDRLSFQQVALTL